MYRWGALHRFLFFILCLSICTVPSLSQAMTDLNGRPASLERYKGKGKWLVVEAWHSQCRVCGMSMPSLVRMVKTLPDAHVMSVSLDGNRQEAWRFLHRYRVRVPTLVSNVNEFNRYLHRISGQRLTGTPTYLIFNPRGHLLGIQAGYIAPTSIRQFLYENQ